MALPAANPHDIDNLLAGYRTARAQQALFDPRGGAVTGYDEFVDAAGNVRPSWLELAECVGERGRGGLEQLRGGGRAASSTTTASPTSRLDTNGDAVTNGDGTAVPGPWHLDALPLVISATDWDTLESGLVQRSRLLDAVLADLYGARRSVTGGVLPAAAAVRPSRLHPGRARDRGARQAPAVHARAATSAGPPTACSWSTPTGRRRRRVPGTHWPTGASSRTPFPISTSGSGPRPASPWAQALRLALIDAAPESAEEPVVVVLSPGIHSETAFDQAYLASVLGFPLVESADLVVRDGKLWMRSLGTLKRVDVVLRRVDAEYADPLDLRADSRLGVVGLVEVLRRGAVTVVNTLGSGILESPGLLRFLPELAETLLGETPLLETAPVYWGGINVERSHLLSKLWSLLIKPVTGGDTIVGPALTAEQRKELGVRIEATPWQWVGQELPQFSSAPTDFQPRRAVLGERRHAAVHGGPARRLRADDRRPRLSAGAGQRRLHDENHCGQGYLGPHPDACHGGADPDLAARRAARDDAEPDARRELAACAVGPVLDGALRRARGEHGQAADRHPRALSRIPLPAGHGRAASACRCCWPRSGRITGTDTGASGDSHEMIATAPTTLWSLTADRHRPGALAQSVERLGLAARAVRDQMSNDTWMVLAAVERAVLHRGPALPESHTEGEAYLVSAHRQTLAGMLALSGAGRRVDGAGRRLDDDGHRQAHRARPRADRAVAARR